MLAPLFLSHVCGSKVRFRQNAAVEYNAAVVLIKLMLAEDVRQSLVDAVVSVI